MSVRRDIDELHYPDRAQRHSYLPTSEAGPLGGAPTALREVTSGGGGVDAGRQGGAAPFGGDPSDLGGDSGRRGKGAGVDRVRGYKRAGSGLDQGGSSSDVSTDTAMLADVAAGAGPEEGPRRGGRSPRRSDEAPYSASGLLELPESPSSPIPAMLHMRTHVDA